MKKTFAFVTILLLVNSLAMAQMMPEGMMGGSTMGGDPPKSSEERESHCAQMMARMSEMMKQMSEMKAHMSMMMESGMMGGMIGPKKKGDKERPEKSQ